MRDSSTRSASLSADAVSMNICGKFGPALSKLVKFGEAAVVRPLERGPDVVFSIGIFCIIRYILRLLFLWIVLLGLFFRLKTGSAQEFRKFESRHFRKFVDRGENSH